MLVVQFAHMDGCSRGASLVWLEASSRDECNRSEGDELRG